MSTDLAYAILRPARPGQARRRFARPHRRRRSGVRDALAHRPGRVGGAGRGRSRGLRSVAAQDRQAAGRRHRPPRRRGLAALQHLRAAERQAAGVVGSAGRPLRHARRPHDVPAHQPSAPSRRRPRICGAASDTKEALAAAVAKWDGLAIEEAIAAGGCVGGLCAAARNGTPIRTASPSPGCR